MKNLIIAVVLLLSAATACASPAKHPVQKVDSVLICQSKSAYAYHSYSCKGLARCTHRIVKMSKSDAVKAGYKPCRYCYK